MRQWSMVGILAICVGTAVALEAQEWEKFGADVPAGAVVPLAQALADPAAHEGQVRHAELIAQALRGVGGQNGGVEALPVGDVFGAIPISVDVGGVFHRGDGGKAARRGQGVIKALKQGQDGRGYVA